MTDMYMLDYKYIIKQLVKILIEKGIYLYNDDYDVTNPIEYYLFKYYVKNTDYFNHNINEYKYYKYITNPINFIESNHILIKKLLKIIDKNGKNLLMYLFEKINLVDDYIHNDNIITLINIYKMYNIYDIPLDKKIFLVYAIKSNFDKKII